MLLRQDVLGRVLEGTVTLAFRRWRRPTVRAGGTLLTPVGQLHLGAVSRVSVSDITEDDAQHAGYPSRAALMEDLKRGTGDIFRIELGSIGPDPRSALRQSLPDDAALSELRERLGRLDARAPGGAWTRHVLELVDAHAGMRAADLCRLADMAKISFKLNVRKLKALGLTESLETGYRLSPRGEALLAALRRDGRGSND